MIAAFSDLDVSHVSGRGQQARSGLGIKVIREIGDGTVPLILAEASAALAGVAFSARRLLWIRSGIGRLRARGQDVEGRVLDERAARRYAGGGEDSFQLSGADH